jgi:osmoprotectant transport system permease protein
MVQPDHRVGGSVQLVNPWWSADWFTSRSDQILAATRQHVLLTVIAVGIGLALSLPLAVLGHRRPRWRGPILAASGVVYTIPSLALFALLVPFTGLSKTTVEIGLVGYTLLILVRNCLTGLANVPADVVDAARGMGYDGLRLLMKVELPLALPAVFGGIRIATVSTIALVTIGAEVSYGGLGRLILEGFQNDYRAEAFGASLLCVALAIVADLFLLGVQRIATPWRRG